MFGSGLDLLTESIIKLRGTAKHPRRPGTRGRTRNRTRQLPSASSLLRCCVLVAAGSDGATRGAGAAVLRKMAIFPSARAWHPRDRACPTRLQYTFVYRAAPRKQVS